MFRGIQEINVLLNKWKKQWWQSTGSYLTDAQTDKGHVVSMALCLHPGSVASFG